MFHKGQRPTYITYTQQQSIFLAFFMKHRGRVMLIYFQIISSPTSLHCNRWTKNVVFEHCLSITCYEILLNKYVGDLLKTPYDF